MDFCLYRLSICDYLQVFRGRTLLTLLQILRGARKDQFSTCITAVGTKFDDPIGMIDDVGVVFHDQYGIPFVYERIKHIEEFADILEVESGRGLIEDIQCVPT